eukprot:TRINITY_DN29979_c0_g1_i1.p1 TRINITY_DN29979_c0_g1~~TRINITY_DN29979_c0_g1_i1.p1  ORF type:complete len:471 (+),score=146.15 TRINITY_DN29979_c0_g1_i1:107-1519(+)
MAGVGEDHDHVVLVPAAGCATAAVVAELSERNRARAVQSLQARRAVAAVEERQRDFATAGFHLYCIRQKNSVVPGLLMKLEDGWAALDDEGKLSHHAEAAKILTARDAAPLPSGPYEMFCQSHNYLRDDPLIQRRQALKRLGELWAEEDKAVWGERLRKLRATQEALISPEQHHRRRLEDMGFVSNDLVLREQALPVLATLDAPTRGALFAPYVFCDPYSFVEELGHCIDREAAAATQVVKREAPPKRGVTSEEVRRLAADCSVLRTQLAAALLEKQRMRRTIAKLRGDAGAAPTVLETSLAAPPASDARPSARRSVVAQCRRRVPTLRTVHAATQTPPVLLPVEAPPSTPPTVPAPAPPPLGLVEGAAAAAGVSVSATPAPAAREAEAPLEGRDYTSPQRPLTYYGADTGAVVAPGEAPLASTPRPAKKKRKVAMVKYKNAAGRVAGRKRARSTDAVRAPARHPKASRE